MSLIEKLRSFVYNKGSNLTGHWIETLGLTPDENVLVVDLGEIYSAELLDGGSGQVTNGVTLEDLEEASKNMASLDWN
jgi:hypothetical protein